MPKNVRDSKRRRAADRDLDVEISFLEGLAGRDHQWVEALKLLGDAYTRRGRVDEGLRVDETLAQLCPEDAIVFYNLACSCALTGRRDEALASLEKAFRLGYNDFKHLARDPDLANLRSDPRYRALIASFRSTEPSV